MSRVCVSAGHGVSSRTPGKVDPGAVGSGIEATKTLGMAQRIVEDLGILGYWTLLRDSGHYSTADDDARRAGCDLFLELHFDAGPKAARGSTGIVGGNSNGRERALARNLSHDVAAAIDPKSPKDRGLAVRTDLPVLRQWPTMDSVLFEIEFITNDAAMRNFEAHVDAVELAIVNCILEHYGRRPVRSLPRTWGRARRLLHYIAPRVV